MTEKSRLPQTSQKTPNVTHIGSESSEGNDSPYSITERRVPELIPFLAVSLQAT